MDMVPLHPMIVHLPMALAVLMPLVTSGILIAWWCGWLGKRSWWLVCALQTAMFAGCLLAMRSGESDEDRVERVVPETVIERHEEAAELFSWGSGLLLVVSLLPLILRRERQARAGGVVTLAGTLALLGLGYKVGVAGGELVYQHGAAAAFTSVDGRAPQRPTADHEHDAGEDHDDHDDHR